MSSQPCPPERRYTHDAANASICNECCNGVNSAGAVFAGVNATQLCGCGDADVVSHEEAPLVFDLEHDVFEETPLTNESWPRFNTSTPSYYAVVQTATVARIAMEVQLHPKPSIGGAGTCTAGLPSAARQPCCEGCHKRLLGHSCVYVHTGDVCTCRLNNASSDGSTVVAIIDEE